jgi:hypothetical protein
MTDIEIERKLAELCGIQNGFYYIPDDWHPLTSIEQAMMVADTFEEWYAGKNDMGEYYCRLARRGVSGLSPECLSYLPAVRTKTISEAICRAAIAAMEDKHES